MDEYDHLTDSQWDLCDRMSGISEDCFCAGWITGNEYDIWEALQNGDASPAHRRMSPRLLRLCQRLSVEIDGWIYWANGPNFAPMAQWLVMVNERQKLVATQKSLIYDCIFLHDHLLHIPASRCHRMGSKSAHAG